MSITINQEELKNIPFTQVCNAATFDKEISNGARGLFTQMCSVKGDSWRPSVSGFSQMTRDGYDAVASQLKELEKHGYVTRGDRYRDERGHLRDATYDLHLDPKGLLGGKHLSRIDTALHDKLDADYADKVMNIIHSIYGDSLPVDNEDEPEF